jgi:hypothetical protein
VVSSVPHTPSKTKEKIDWVAVALFYFLACACSWPFFWWRDMWPESWVAWRIPGFLKTSTYMWGPGLAAIVSIAMRGQFHHRTITFFGSAERWAVAYYLVPLIVLASAYALSTGARGPVVVGLIAIVGFFNILGEELGWRGFLQDALRPLPKVWRYLVIGVLWEAWHFTNRIHGRDWKEVIATLAISYPIVIAVSGLIGEITDRSKCLVVAVTFHFWLDALPEVPTAVAGPAATTYAVFGASLIFWGVLLWNWPRGTDLKAKEQGSEAAPKTL